MQPHFMLQRAYAIAHLSICLSVTRVDQSKTVEVRIVHDATSEIGSETLLADKIPVVSL